jgi:hypothetical protein
MASSRHPSTAASGQRSGRALEGASFRLMIQLIERISYGAWLGFARVPSCTLGQEQNAPNNERRDDRGSDGSAER